MPPDIAANAAAMESISGFTVWLLGASLGMTACAVSCLPFIGTWVFGRGEQGRDWDLALFLGGRLIAYTMLGALAGGLGRWFVQELSQGWGNVAIGMASLASALWLAWPHQSHRNCAALNRCAGLSPLLLGAALTLIPCAPLATLLSTCAAGGDAWQGGKFGALFGAGALLTPMLFLVPAVGSLARRIQANRQWLAPWLQRGAALVLALLGLRRIGLVDDGVAVFCAVLAMTLLALRFTCRPKRADGLATIKIVRREISSTE